MPKRALPGADADYGLRGDFQAFLGMDLGHVVDPGAGVFEIDDAPREGPRDDPVEAAADRDARAVLGILRGPGAAHGIVRQSSVAVIPLFGELRFEGQVVDLLGDFPSAEHELAKGREAVRRERSVAESAAVERESPLML